MGKGQFDCSQCCDCSFCDFQHATQALEQEMEEIEGIDYPDADFDTFRFYMVPASNKYYELAWINGCIKKHPETVQAYVNYHPVFLKMANEIMPFLAKNYGQRLDTWAAQWSQKHDSIFARLMAKDIVGVSICYFPGINFLVDTLQIPEFTENVPDDGIVTIDEINIITEILYGCVMGWKDKFYALDEELQRLVRYIYAQRFPESLFPYPPPQADDSDTKWSLTKISTKQIEVQGFGLIKKNL